MRDRLQARRGLQVSLQPGCGHGARRKPGHAGELDHVFVTRFGQHPLELGVGIALERYRERCAELHAGGAQALQATNVLQRADAAGGDDRRAAFDACRAQDRERLRHRAFEVETRIVQLVDTRRAQVAARVPRVFQHDRVGHPLLTFPLANDQLHAARVREDGDQCGLRMIGREIGQVQRKPGADNHRVDAGLQRTCNVRGVVADSTHDVHRQQPSIPGDAPRRGDFTIEGFEVAGVDGRLRVGADTEGARARHQVGVVATQVDGAERADRAGGGHVPREAVRRHADAHAALDDRQQRVALEAQRGEPAALQQQVQVRWDQALLRRCAAL